MRLPQNLWKWSLENYIRFSSLSICRIHLFPNNDSLWSLDSSGCQMNGDFFALCKNHSIFHGIYVRFYHSIFKHFDSSSDLHTFHLIFIQIFLHRFATTLFDRKNSIRAINLDFCFHFHFLLYFFIELKTVSWSKKKDFFLLWFFWLWFNPIRN